jgi:hypothetical protein
MSGGSIDLARERPASYPDPACRRFNVRHMTIEGGRDLAFDEAEWRDAIVVVERGSLDIECLGGKRSTFATGAVLCLDRLPLRTLHNAGSEPVLLFAVSRGKRPS